MSRRSMSFPRADSRPNKASDRVEGCLSIHRFSADSREVRGAEKSHCKPLFGTPSAAAACQSGHHRGTACHWPSFQCSLKRDTRGKRIIWSQPLEVTDTLCAWQASAAAGPMNTKKNAGWFWRCRSQNAQRPSGISRVSVAKIAILRSPSLRCRSSEPVVDRRPHTLPAGQAMPTPLFPKPADAQKHQSDMTTL